MKKLFQILMLTLVALFISACYDQDSKGQNLQEKSKPMMETKESTLGDTSKEDADQKDPTLIEGNLENNDFKN